MATTTAADGEGKDDATPEPIRIYTKPFFPAWTCVPAGILIGWGLIEGTKAIEEYYDLPHIEQPLIRDLHGNKPYYIYDDMLAWLNQDHIKIIFYILFSVVLIPPWFGPQIFERLPTRISAFYFEYRAVAQHVMFPGFAIFLAALPGQVCSLGDVVFDWRHVWAGHFVGWLVADWWCSGPHVNPAVTCAMWICQKEGKGGQGESTFWGQPLTFSHMVMVWAAQVLGGVSGYPSLQFCFNVCTPSITPSYPQFHGRNVESPGGAALWTSASSTPAATALAVEFCGAFALALATLLFNNTSWGPPAAAYPNENFPSVVFLRSRPLVAAVGRALFATGGWLGLGCVGNPALATTWLWFTQGDSHAFPTDPMHYVVFWGGGLAGGAAAAIVFKALCAGGDKALKEKSS